MSTTSTTVCDVCGLEVTQTDHRVSAQVSEFDPGTNTQTSRMQDYHYENCAPDGIIALLEEE
jgi:hypothetical protein